MAVEQHIGCLDSASSAGLPADGDDLYSANGLSSDTARHKQQRGALVEFNVNASWHAHIREPLDESGTNCSDDSTGIQQGFELCVSKDQHAQYCDGTHFPSGENTSSTLPGIPLAMYPELTTTIPAAI